MNVFTLGDLLEVPAYILKNRFSVVYYELRKKLLGFDSDPVASIYDAAPPKSVGNGTTTLVDIFTREEIRETLVFLAEKISSRMRKKGFYANAMSVTIKNVNLKNAHASRTLPESINSAKDIVKYAMQIIEQFWKFDEKIRAIRISCTNLTNGEATQLSIFQSITEKKSALNNALDEIRAKYGKESIKPANMLSTKLTRDTFE